MAEKTLQRVQDQLICPICLDTYTNPKQLQCHHVYCQQCLSRLVRKNQQRQLIVICPKCRQVTLVPAGGVADFQGAFQINQLLDIIGEHQAKPGDSAKTNTVAPPQFCSEHGKELELYCETCQKVVCCKCVTRAGQHHKHEFEDLCDVIEKCKEEILVATEPVKEVQAAAESALAELTTQYKKIIDKRALAEAEIHKNFQQLQHAIDDKNFKITRNIQSACEDKVQFILARQEAATRFHAETRSFLHYVKDFVESRSHREVLEEKCRVIKELEKLATRCPRVEAIEESDITYVLPANFLSACHNLGVNLALHFTVEPPKVFPVHCGTAILGQKCTVQLKAMHDVNPHTLKDTIESIKCQLVSSLTGAIVKGSAEWLEERSTISLSYSPVIKGQHELHVTIYGKHVVGSPFRVAVKAPVMHFAFPIRTISGVGSPCGIAVDQKGNVVVTEEDRHCVSVFSPLTGKKILSFGEFGVFKGQFKSPYGVAIDSKGNILVTDQNNHRIQKFSPQGDFLASVGSKGLGPLLFKYPRGIAVNPCNDKVYVVDWNDSVHILNPDLTFGGRFGMEGDDRLEFKSPHGLACNSTGNLFVADTENFRIQSFTREGKFLKMFGEQLQRLSGIAVDNNNAVYVSEGNNNRVSVFNSNGQQVTSFGNEFLKCPRGLAVDESGVIYVCDSGHNCIKIY